MPNLVTRLEALLTESGHEFAEVRGIGVSLPGTVDLAAGASLDSPS